MSRAMLARKAEAAPAAKAKAASTGVFGDLRIGEPDDAFEQEADRMSDAIMAGTKAGPRWSFGTMSITPSLQRKCACDGSETESKCEECSKKNTLQRKAAGPSPPDQVPPIVHEALRLPGEPLDARARAFMEPRFGRSFADVRIHADVRAAESARAVNASAYTIGRHLVFGTGHYAPDSTDGRRLLAHELTHVVQQTQGEHGHDLSRDDAEREARGAADNERPVSVTGRRPEEIARAPPGSQPLTGSNFTPEQRKLLQAARATLKPKGVSIVGVLIAEDGRQFPIESGGGQGFSSHLEGKATAKMKELGIKKATLLSELEPCQLCDRSDYPAEAGPEAPMKSTRTGKELTRQTSKINSSLPQDSELQVVGPESTGLYRGTGPTVAQPKGTATGSGGQVTDGPGAEVHSESPAPGTKNLVTDEPQTDIPTQELKKPGVTGAPEVETPSAPKTRIAAEEEPGVSGSPAGPGSGTAMAITGFSVGLSLAGWWASSEIDEMTIKRGFNEQLQSEKWQARLKDLQPTVMQSKGNIYYNIRYAIHYGKHQSAAVKTVPQWSEAVGVEFVGIDVGKDKIDHCGEANWGPKRHRIGGGWDQDGQSICTTSSQVESGEQAEQKRERQQRAQEQREIAERLERAAVKRKATEKPPEQPPKPPSGPPALLPVPDAPAVSFLPGASAEGPIEKAARFTKKAENWAQQLLQDGTALESLISSGNPLSGEQEAKRETFLQQEQQWRDGVKYMKNWLQDQGYDQPVRNLAELLDRFGSRLSELRDHLKR